MSLQDFRLLVPHSEKNHQISMARTKQTPKKPTNGKQPSAKSIKTAAAARKELQLQQLEELRSHTDTDLAPWPSEK